MTERTTWWVMRRKANAPRYLPLFRGKHRSGTTPGLYHGRGVALAAHSVSGREKRDGKWHYFTYPPKDYEPVEVKIVEVTDEV